MESILRFAARTACKLPAPILKRLSGPTIEIDGQTLDPLVQFLVRNFADKPGDVGTVESTRHSFDTQGTWMDFPHHPSVKAQRGSFDGPAGGIPYEMYRPKGLPAKDAPVMVFYHGGGHTGGSIKSHAGACRELARRADIAVVSVEYRLAPEHRFPVGIDDCLAAYDAVFAQADTLGIDRARIAVGGDSAGANVAAVLAQQRKDAPHPPAYQILWVPWVDMSKQTRSYDLFDVGFFLEKPKMEWYIDNYLAAPEDAMHPKASPILGDVSGVCPAALLIAGFDPLRDEGVAYGEKLKAAGVATDVKVYDTLVHPFVNVAGCVPAAAAAFDDAVGLLRENL